MSLVLAWAVVKCHLRNCHEITVTEILDKHRIIGIDFRKMFNLFLDRA